MPIIAIVEYAPTEGVDMRAEYSRVEDEINGGRPFERPEDWGGGLISHAAAPTEGGGGLVVDVWEDREHMDAWMAKVTPHLNDAPEPTVRVLETINVVTAGQRVHA
jgi:hypothetical protein